MANVITCTFFIQDAKSRSAKLLFRSNLDESFPMAAPEQALSAAIFYYQTLAQRLDLLINGRIANISIAVDVEMPLGIKSTAISYSDVEEGALFIFPKNAYSAYFRNTVPTFDHSIFLSGTELASGEFPVALTLYIQWLIASENEDIYEDAGQITDNRGERVTGFPSIFKTFKRSLK